MERSQKGSLFVKVLTGTADLLILNLAVVVCCLPVITIGAAMTGMHYVLLRKVRNEEGYVLQDYFRSFRENFLQATALWCLFLLFGAVLFLDLSLILSAGEISLQIPPVLRFLVAGGGIYVSLIYLYVFPLLARFQNTSAGTIASAAKLAAAAFPRTIAMAAATLVLPAAVLSIPALFPLEILLGLTGPGFLCALIYNPVFLRIEEKIRSTSEP